MTTVLLALAFGLAIGLSVGLVGGGGAILAVPLLVYVFDVDVKRATTTSLVVVAATAAAGAIDHARGGRVRWRIALGFGAAGALGSLAGTAANRHASGDAILLLLAVLLLAVAAVMLRRPEAGPRAIRAGRDLRLRVAGAGLAVGVLTGFFGVGGGFLIVPSLLLVLGLATQLAIATSLVVVVAVSAVALVAHLSTGSADWTLAAALAAGGAVGAVAGSRLGERVGARGLARAFAILLAAVGAYLLARSGAALAG